MVLLFQSIVLILYLPFVILNGSLNHFLEVHDLRSHILLDDFALLQFALKIVFFLQLSIQKATYLFNPIPDKVICILTEMLECGGYVFIIFFELSQLGVDLVENKGVVFE
jgi:hypothetical protein